ncbi:uncharacterized protein MEPE_02032 [Melanopsichium pennsylvanicum]|uniref:Sec39 domain-containing protein n=2 Tax=Melanopsichium pennsylvanicum TaxID=63383 RepID=A0AAJ5C455_9BASI|nr:sec39-domain-containing protein [Melanopsichium pennsylvanicum 4]SNX83325.1 uncharacterized protein MEPE_02032 [Melanopsichium pennsylvanicum]
MIMMVPTDPQSAAGPSTTKTRKSKSTIHSSERQNQRRWIQLIESWHGSTASTSPRFAKAPSRDDLVEEISAHAQTLCRTIQDKQWLLDAFRFAIAAVLFFQGSDTAPQDDQDLSRVEQLGQQLLQLAIHSIALPYLNTVKMQNAQSSTVEAIEKAVEKFEQWSRRLSLFERLQGSTGMLGLPNLPLRLVLEEETSTVLLCLSSLPHGAELVGSVLQGLSWLVQESATVRLPILAQLLTSAGADYESLSASGLLVCWKDGSESSVWASGPGVRSLTLRELVDFYRGILGTLQQTKSDSEVQALLVALSKGTQGQDAQQAIAELYNTLSASSSDHAEVQSSAINAQRVNDQRFDLPSVKSLFNKVSATGTSIEGRKQLAQQCISTRNTAAVAKRLTQLVDTHDNATVRSFTLSAVSEASKPYKLAPLAAAVLYARPAVGEFRLDLNTSQTLLKEAESLVLQLVRGQNAQKAKDSNLGEALRSVFAVDQRSVVPACQLLALLSATSAEETAALLHEAQQHLAWLRDISALFQDSSSKCVGIDLCWLSAFGGAQQTNGVEKEQASAFEKLLASFSTSHPPPSSFGGRQERPSTADTQMLRYRAAWDQFFHTMLALCGPSSSAPFALVSQSQSLQLLLRAVLREGDVDLYKTLSASSTTTSTLSETQLEDLVLRVSMELFDRANVASTRSRDIRLSSDILSALSSSSSRGKAQKGFIEACCRLSSFKIKSLVKPAAVIEPKEIRETKDKLELISRMLATQADAYRSPELVLDLANKICGEDGGGTVEDKVLIEARCLAMLADAAVASEDFEDAAQFCSRLVEKTTTTWRRSGDLSEVQQQKRVVLGDLAWKSCYQLSKHPGWQDTPSRITMLCHAMSICPATQLNAMLRQYTMLDLQMKEELEGGKVYASTKKAAAAAAAGGGIGIGGGWSMGGARGMGDVFTAQTAATMGAGLVGTAANLLPLSFSPLSYFGGSSYTDVKGNSASIVGGGSVNEQANAAIGVGVGRSNVDERTAKLFDFDSVSGASNSQVAGERGYVDPTERAVRAARAARDFLGWKHSTVQQDQNSNGEENDGRVLSRQGGGATASGFGGFSLSKGVGWLIGDERH